MLQLRQSQSLQQRLTPQQVQYLKLLQLPILSLEQRIKSELEENPMLEEASEEEESAQQGPTEEQIAERVEAEPIAEAAGGTLEGSMDERSAVSAADREERMQEDSARETSAAENDYSFEDFMNDDTEGWKTPTAGQFDEDREDVPHAAQESFTESLYNQIAMLNLPDKYRALAEEIVGSIDEDGYLRVPLEQVAKDAGVFYGVEYTLPEAEAILHKIQKLDPAGCAARDLRECLAVQLEVMPNHNPTREVARRIVHDRFDDFVNRRFAALSRHLGMDLTQLKPAIELIQHLNPKPGAPSGELSESTKYITADFYIEKTPDGKDFLITLNERGVPPLRVNAAYKDLIRKQAPEHGQHLNAEAKDFIKKKFEAAKFFIMAIYQRRETMMRVMQSIIAHQRGFFEHGEKLLRPLIYKTIAEDIGMDISTICRVVNGKYCQTDFGVFELKYFFSEAIPTHAGEGGENSEGEAVANKVVKSRIKDIIDAEDGREPLSDEKIVQLLNTEGFDVARRTVAKYREQMNVPVARLRKKLM
ncbi:MAG: RNA polymerase factor sigma-54 [Bacteroidota bacterium]|nr:RNA polymerase factor sigma-54 [Bacteroidota bacterium]MDP4233013.1 RNA polymerase factor sigma-54 [Bacteroidota bacterium]MDP4241842.1 RNA polymerase factor sigma-54 [Bacteroidota bacterium]MDP4288391.1 RNA polymerase factor sigma-54 [Bacteroidota bacterium]